MTAKIIPVANFPVLSDAEHAQYESVVTKTTENLRAGRGETVTWARGISDRVARAVGRAFIGAGWDVQLHEMGDGFTISVTHPKLLEPPIQAGLGPGHTHTIEESVNQSAGPATTPAT